MSDINYNKAFDAVEDGKEDLQRLFDRAKEVENEIYDDSAKEFLQDLSRFTFQEVPHLLATVETLLERLQDMEGGHDE